MTTNFLNICGALGKKDIFVYQVILVSACTLLFCISLVLKIYSILSIQIEMRFDQFDEKSRLKKLLFISFTHRKSDRKLIVNIIGKLNRKSRVWHSTAQIVFIVFKLFVMRSTKMAENIILPISLQLILCMMGYFCCF